MNGRSLTTANAKLRWSAGGSKLINLQKGSCRTSGDESEEEQVASEKYNRCLYSKTNIVQGGGFQLGSGKNTKLN